MKRIAQIASLILVMFPCEACCATWYISTTGSDKNSGSSPTAAFATFAHALAVMSGCDTLIVESGYYYDVINNPPGGNITGSGCYTIIEAETTWGATLDSSTQSHTGFIGALNIGGSNHSYIQVIGLKFAGDLANTSGQGPVGVGSGANHIKLQQTAAYNAPCGGNGTAWNIDVYGIGPSSSYILVEDSHAWGCGRYKFLAYQSDHVIFRRDVSRHDFAGNGAGGVMSQCATFTSYDSQYTLFQNDVAIDSGDAARDTGNLYGALWSEHHISAIDNPLVFEGSIVDNVQADVGLQDAKQSGTHTFINDAVVNSNAGLEIGELINTYAVTGVTFGASTATITSSSSNPVWGLVPGVFNGLTGSAAVLNGTYYTVPSLSIITSITGTAPNMTVYGSFPDWSSGWVGALLSLGGATNAGNDSNNSGGTQFTITGGSTTSISYSNASGVAETLPGGAWVEVSPEFKVNYSGTPGGPYSTGGTFGVLNGVTPPTVNVSHMTIANILNTTSNYVDAGNGAEGIGVEGQNPFYYYASQSLTNNIIQNVSASTAPRSFGVSDWITPDYDYYYSNKQNFGSTFYQSYTPTAGAHDVVNVDPRIKYITREEPGTPVYGTASDGGNIGATILYEIGAIGTLYGDTGYDAVSSTPLWPFPNESVIQSDMASFSMVNPISGGTISGTRGFAASGNGLYGGPITLTSYIWEALGFPCPAGICTPPVAPAAPTSLTGSVI